MLEHGRLESRGLAAALILIALWLASPTDAGASCPLPVDFRVSDQAYYSYIVSPGTGGPLSMVSRFWALGSGDPAVGEGNDNGTYEDDQWLVPLGDAYSYFGFGDWSNPGVDGCIDGQVAPGKTEEIMVAEFSDRDPSDTFGFFAVAAVRRTPAPDPPPEFDFGFVQGGGVVQDILLQPIPEPMITGAQATASTVTVHLQPPSVPDLATGFFTDGSATPEDLIEGVAVYSQVVPMAASPPSSRHPAEGWTYEDTVPLDEPATVTVSCTVGFTAYLAYRVAYDSGFESFFVSLNSPPVPCGCQGLDNDLDGFTDCDGDCDDGNDSVYPGATEVPCDGFNNDCDEPSWPVPPADEIDNDGDGWSECAGDCDDARATVAPGANQICFDGLNNDCSDPAWPGLDGTNESDEDGDGFSPCDGDCDATDPALNPAAADTCDGLDNDCDGVVDGGDADPQNGIDAACESWVEAWSSPGMPQARAVAWGDVDLDGDLDLAVAVVTGSNRVYENLGGELRHDPAGGYGWSSVHVNGGRDLAWGDWDGDGDLDLAVGNGQKNRVYRNLAGHLAVGWKSSIAEDTHGLAWGDWDGDGDLDLAVGNAGEPNRVYAGVGAQNPGCGVACLETTATWESAEDDDTRSVAWGDWDADGDLDLAVGNHAGANRVYENDAGTLTLAWSSTETEDTSSVAWGDWDGDGDLDLAVGNLGAANRIYDNDAGTLTVVWSSLELDDTVDLSLGDWDGDGDLDLAAGNDGQADRIYENDGGTLKHDPSNIDPSLRFGWQSSSTSSTRGIAFGDWNGDGDLDLAVGHDDAPLQLQDSPGTPISADRESWESTETDDNPAVSWGDWDGDGDLDLAVASPFSPSRVYRNDGGDLVLAWSAFEEDWTFSVAWGDWDGDGDLDLATGNYGDPNRVYENFEGDLFLEWSSPESDFTQSLAWGDWDGDGDLDLAAGNDGDPNRVYDNDGGELTLAWSSIESDLTSDIAWGDFDGDGDLDLAAGNFGQANRVYESKLDYAGRTTLEAIDWNPGAFMTVSVAWGDRDGDGDLDLATGNDGGANRIYDNDAGRLTVGWTSDETDDTQALAWGDWDGDGDLDLAAANWEQPNRVYLNTGESLILVWSSVEAEDTLDAAWGDWDGDGDDDLAFGNWQQPNRVRINGYVNRSAGLPESPVYPVAIDRPGSTDAARFYSSAERLDSPVEIPYTLFDDEADRAWSVIAQFSLNGGGAWQQATAGPGCPGVDTQTTNLEASPAGSSHAFCWDAEADDACSEQALFRIGVPWQAPDHAGSPVQRPHLFATSLPFALDCPVWYLDDDGDGLGDGASSLASRVQPMGYVANPGDVDDTRVGCTSDPGGCVGYFNPSDRNELTWPAWSGVTQYEVVRAEDALFQTACTLETTSETHWTDTDPAEPGSGTVWFYLVRPLPGGSWGTGSSETTRDPACD